MTGEGFAQALAGARFESVARRGKFLVFTLSGAGVQLNAPTQARGDESDGPAEFLVINPKLTGRLQVCEPKAEKAVWPHILAICGFNLTISIGVFLALSGPARGERRSVVLTVAAIMLYALPAGARGGSTAWPGRDRVCLPWLFQPAPGRQIRLSDPNSANSTRQGVNRSNPKYLC